MECPDFPLRPKPKGRSRRKKKPFRGPPGSVPDVVSTPAQPTTPVGGARRSRPPVARQRNHSVTDVGADLTQRLTAQLTRDKCECAVCMAVVTRTKPTWSCSTCFAVFHQRCIHSWITKGIKVVGTSIEWRCPACQEVHRSHKLPPYECWCGRLENPSHVQYGSLPHSCQLPCGRAEFRSAGRRCLHPCPMECHPGPCPPCAANATIKCHCGATGKTERCGATAPWSCGGVCNRLLSCQQHRCQKKCHGGGCGDCELVGWVRCSCGKDNLPTICGLPSTTPPSCGQPCGKFFPCGHHVCSRPCHAPAPSPTAPCGPCPNLTIWDCPCGKTLIRDLVASRANCTDPIPCCSKICAKSRDSCDHPCAATCHTDECPKCQIEISQKCRCGKLSQKEVCSAAAPWTCEISCKKLKDCGRHLCNQLCCPASQRAPRPNSQVHRCSLICGRALACGKHTCESRCHLGACPPCGATRSTPLSCACGFTQIPPPTFCGTPPPVCTQVCNKKMDCGHECIYACHFGPCPECRLLVDKECAGKHTTRPNIQCCMDPNVVSCGKSCGKYVPSCEHLCSRPCHPPPCPPCSAVCDRPRKNCVHFCQSPCHASAPCPDVPCQLPTHAICPCGHRRVKSLCGCSDVHTVNRSTLECGQECKAVERQRQLAAALGQNTLEGHERDEEYYEEDLVEWSRRNPKLIEIGEKKLISAIGSRAVGLHMPAMPGSSRLWLTLYISSHWGMLTTVDKDFSDAHKHLVVTYVQGLSQTPVPLISQVVKKTPDLSKNPLPLVSFKKENVIRFSAVSPRVRGVSVSSDCTVFEVSRFLRSFRNYFRIRWFNPKFPWDSFFRERSQFAPAPPPLGTVREAMVLVECFSSDVATSVYERLSGSQILLTSLSLEIPNRAVPPATSPITTDAWDDRQEDSTP